MTPIPGQTISELSRDQEQDQGILTVASLEKIQSPPRKIPEREQAMTNLTGNLAAAHKVTFSVTMLTNGGTHETWTGTLDGDFPR